jgi:ATP-dependent Clp protease ATP-binding subunit ClpX
MFDLPGMEGVEEVVVNAEVVTGDAAPLYIYAKSQKDVAPKQGA